MDVDLSGGLSYDPSLMQAIHLTMRGSRRRLLHRGRAALVSWPMLLVAAGVLVSGCSQGTNPLLNPKSNRTGLTAKPDSLPGMEPTADRTYRPRILTGSLAVCTVAREESLEAVTFLKFESLPDTTAMVRATLRLTYLTGAGTGLKLVFYDAGEVDTTWTESAVTFPEEPWPDSVFVRVIQEQPLIGDAVVVDGGRKLADLVRYWAQHPERNRGLAVRFSHGSASGELQFYSREAAVGVALAPHPRLLAIKDTGDSTGVIASADTYAYRDSRKPESGGNATFTLSAWPPQRGLLRFPIPALPDSLWGGSRPFPKGTTVNRALLRLRVVQAGPDTGTLVLGLRSSLTDWNEGTQPDSVGQGSTVYDLVQIDARTDSVEIDLGPLVQVWLDGVANQGFQLYSLGEGAGLKKVTFYSREALDPSLRPTLELVYTPPLGFRWGDQGGAP